jgi:hypothetical protein
VVRSVVEDADATDAQHDRVVAVEPAETEVVLDGVERDQAAAMVGGSGVPLARRLPGTGGRSEGGGEP